MLGTTIILAFRAINRHKLRSFLTTLGIIIGVAAVVTMVTLGNGATAAVREQISSLGANVLQLRPGQGFGRGGGGPRPPDFKEADMTAIENRLTGVRAVAPLVQSSGTARDSVTIGWLRSPIASSGVPSGVPGRARFTP